jgi:hypothetical protein
MGIVISIVIALCLTFGGHKTVGQHQQDTPPNCQGSGCGLGGGGGGAF